MTHATTESGNGRRYRRPWGLACWFDGGKLLVDSFIRGSAFRCPPRLVPLLASADDPASEAELLTRFTELGSPDPRHHLSTLLANGGLLAIGSPEDERDRELARTWDWGIRTALYHFSTRNVGWATDYQEAAFHARQSVRDRSGCLWTPNSLSPQVVKLARPGLGVGASLMRTILSRRSRRNFSGDAISIADLADCLYAAHAITTVETLADGQPTPFKNAPSAGGRNPFEIYLYAHRVRGLPPGFYHYSATEHSLGTAAPVPAGLPMCSLAGGQDWANSAAAMVFLVTDFERTMWRYTAASAYLTVLLEAGHIGQNILLAAEDRGLHAVPCSALAHEDIEQGIKGCTGADGHVLYAVVLGGASASGDPLAEPPTEAFEAALADDTITRTPHEDAIAPPATGGFRRPWGLACWFDGGKLLVDSFIRGSAFRCPPRLVPLLASADDPASEAELLTRFTELGSPDPRHHLSTLLANGGLLAIGSPEDERDRELARTWDWGIRTALYHFSTRNVGWATSQQEAVFLASRTAAKPAPAAWQTNAGLSTVAACPRWRHRPSPLLETIERRRSRRNFSGAPISLASLGQCLHGGLGITGFAELPYRPRTPFKNTPSAGGRNPFEAFVLVNAVDGLSPGVHHYSSSEHSLELRQPAPPGLRISDLMGEQEWLDRAAAIVFLVAEFQRTMGASAGIGAFGTVYIEAGHIAQNIMLVATELGLAGVQTNAFLHDQVEELLTVTAPTHAVLYAIALGEPSEHYDPISGERRAVNGA